MMVSVPSALMLIFFSPAMIATASRKGFGQVFDGTAVGETMLSASIGDKHVGKRPIQRSNSFDGLSRPSSVGSDKRGILDWTLPITKDLELPNRRHQVANCKGHAFDIVGGDGAQDWLSNEFRKWKTAVRMSLNESPEATAAKALLKKDAASKGLYWASISNATTSSTGGKPRLEAIAKVVKKGHRFGIPLIISRRALFGRDQGIGGAGKALIGGLTELFGMQADMEEEDLRIGGTPGDKFVAGLYRDHGAEKINATQDIEGMLTFGTLEFLVPQGCSQFFARAVCTASTWADYGRFAARALQAADSDAFFHPVESCADMFPKQFIWDRIKAMFR